MTRPILLAAALILAAAGPAPAAKSNYPGVSNYDYWRGEACGDGGDVGSPCETLFKRLCGASPNAGCVKRNQKAFARAPKFNR